MLDEVTISIFTLAFVFELVGPVGGNTLIFSSLNSTRVLA